MPISNVSEFEAVIGQALIAIDKKLVEVGDRPKLKEARRDLEKLAATAREAPKAKAMRANVATLADVLMDEMSRETDLHDAMWDLLDFLDYRM